MNSSVLVVAGDPALRETVEAALAAEGYDVSVVGDGVEALEVLETELPALILLENAPPMMDGEELVAELDRRGLRHRLPVLLLTDGPSTEVRARRMRVAGALDIPPHVPLLLDEVARLVSEEDDHPIDEW